MISFSICQLKNVQMHIFKVVAICGFFQACLAFIDPISLSAVGAAVLTYFGLSSAAVGTIAAGLATGGIGALLALNNKLGQEGLPKLDDKGDAVLLCFVDRVTLDLEFLNNSFCKHVVHDHVGCKINLKGWDQSGVHYNGVCAASLTNVKTTLHKYDTVWSAAKCKVFIRGKTALKDIDTFDKCIKLYKSK